jgi:hypothetical protein
MLVEESGEVAQGNKAPREKNQPSFCFLEKQKRRGFKELA